MLIDITRPIHPKMAIYPGNPAVEFTRVQEARDGQSALTKITIGSHTGTHIDAPSHIDPAGKGTDHYALDQLIGASEVIDLTAISDVITASDLPPTSSDRVLIKTRNSSGDPNSFDPNFVALDESAAGELVKRGIKLVGLDALSIKKKGVKDRVHEILLSASVIILEGLWLSHVEPGSYELLCLPLSVVNLDGAPVRAVLRKDILNR